MNSPQAPGDVELDFSLVEEAASPAGVDEGDLEQLASFVLREEAASGPWAVAVALVDDTRLQALHRDYMASDTPTDIMTFPLEDVEGGAQGGDLVISVDHALTQGAAWGHSPADEIAFLVAHGLLHLLGWRDEDDQDRELMLARQQVLFDRWRRG